MYLLRYRDLKPDRILGDEKVLGEQDFLQLPLGAIFILRKDIGVGGWSRKWQFSLTLCSENVLT